MKTIKLDRPTGKCRLWDPITGAPICAIGHILHAEGYTNQDAPGTAEAANLLRVSFDNLAAIEEVNDTCDRSDECARVSRINEELKERGLPWRFDLTAFTG